MQPARLILEVMRFVHHEDRPPFNGLCEEVFTRLERLIPGQGARRANPHASVESLTARISHRPRKKK
jgi:hypothetical protein